MNGKAKEIGMTNSNFKNSTGLHEEKYYTTAYDMAILLEYSLRNEDFENFFTSFEHVTESNLLLTSSLLKKEGLETRTEEEY